jgi:hypothetical protein
MTEPEHSNLGGSGAERWMNCPGSGVILKRLQLPQSDEQDYRRDGVAAHEAASDCLLRSLDTWEIIGQTYHGVVVDEAMARHIQTYIDDCRQFLLPGVTPYIEYAIGANKETRPHPGFYGRLDFGAWGKDETVVEDFKFGEGIVVDPDDNPQLKYYAYGLIRGRIDAGAAVRSDRVFRLRICQPRAWHHDGPIREWETTAGEIIHWAENELLPAMQRAEIDVTLDPGAWCRFCPAKLFCPMLSGLFGAAATADPNVVPNFGQQRLGLEYARLQAVNFYIKAVKDETYRRNMLANTVPGTKLVLQKANRIWDGSAEALAKERFGVEALTAPELKSPAELEKLGAKAKAFVKEHAFMPQNGLTVVLETDPKPAVKVEKAADIFAHLIDKGDQDAIA